MKFYDPLGKSTQRILLASVACLCVGLSGALAYEPKTLEIGAQAPNFDLMGTDDKHYSLSSFSDKPLLVVIFTTNHCPDAITSYSRMCQMVSDYGQRGVGFVAINGNDPKAVRLDEMRWTKYDDTFESMKIVATKEKFNLPYLYDGETQDVTKAYGAVATPHVFIFDQERSLQYTGRLDNRRRSYGVATKSEARDALDAMLAGKPVPVGKTRVFGCSIKWSDKRSLVSEAQHNWEKRPVSLASADANMIKKLVASKSPTLKLFHVWSTSCGPCLQEFPGLVEMYRRFQNHPFEFITISVDSPAQKDQVTGFLTENHVAVAKHTKRFLSETGRETNNFLFIGDDLEYLAAALDPQWTGAQPHTLLVAPDGKVLFRQTGIIEIDPLRAAIVKYAHANFLE